MPLRARDPNIVSAAWAAPMPTISAKEEKKTQSKNLIKKFFFGSDFYGYAKLKQKNQQE